MDERLQKIKSDRVIRVAVTGPESTGKSYLARVLSNHYNTGFVEEFARTYIHKLRRPYNLNDIEIIAKQQMQNEDKLFSTVDKLLIADTELIVIKVWMDFKYGIYPGWINDEIDKREYDLYLLCDIDLPWEDDPQREHPNKRNELFDIYISELKSRKFNFIVISGNEQQRFQTATEAIEKLLS